MSNHQNDNAKWAQENGYEFHAESQGVISGGARSLDIFGKADSYRDHVLGTHRNRPFEILDVWVERVGQNSFSFWQTVVVIPTSGLNLPNFDLVPRREAGGMNFLGVKGLDLKLAPAAPLDERQMVEAFKKNYSLFGGGAHETMVGAIKSADHLSDVASICKPGVLRFLSTAVTGFIEVQDGYLAIKAAETRVFTAGVSDIILEGSERESLLTVANDFLDVLAISAREAPLRALTLENTFRPAQFLGSIIGIAIGFIIGSIASVILLIVFKGKYLYLLPLVILGGVALGRFIGNWLTRAK
jgi:hypothetical protein